MRVTRRDLRGPTVAHGPLEVTPIARVVGLGIGGPAGVVGLSLARPGRVEVRRGGVLQRRVPLPDWALRVWVGAAATLALAVILRTRLGRS